MDYSKYSYLILCEDKTQYGFIRGFLKEKGANQRKIELFNRLPEGKESGLGFVLHHFNDAVAKLQNRRAKAKTILIVTLDCDPSHDPRTSEETAKECYDAIKSKFTLKQNVILLLPCRNIETWFYYLDNQDLTESNSEIPDRKRSVGNKPTRYGRRMAQCSFADPGCIPASLLKTKECVEAAKPNLV